MSGKRYDLSLSLLDRQIVDRDGYAAGKVDDLEFEWRPGSPPFVGSILSGPGALSSRIGGRIGRWMATMHARLQETPAPGPAKISFGVVTKIEEAVHIGVSRDELPVMRFRDWARQHIIDKIPGAGHEAE